MILKLRTTLIVMYLAPTVFAVVVVNDIPFHEQ